MSEFNSSERDSSGTTEGLNEMKPEGDGADSPTRARKAREAARPTSALFFVMIIFVSGVTIFFGGVIIGMRYFVRHRQK
jgi:hypothetical protein